MAFVSDVLYTGDVSLNFLGGVAEVFECGCGAVCGHRGDCGLKDVHALVLLGCLKGETPLASL